MLKNPILVVEDNATESFLLKRILEKMGYAVLELEHGKNLLETLDENDIQLLIIDWNLPYFNGIELVKMVRNSKEFKSLPIIIITRFVEETILEEAFNSGANDFISKPFQAKEVECRVNNLLDSFNRMEIITEKNGELKELHTLIKNQNEKLKESLRLNAEISNQKKEKLEQDFSQFRNKMMNQVLTSISADEKMQQVNKSINQLKTCIESNKSKEHCIQQISEILKLIEKFQVTDLLWIQFTELFDHLIDGFFEKLKQIYPNLSTVDLRICAFIKMELDYLEIANILSLDPNNFKMKRYRLKKKLKIPQDQSLRVFLSKL